jgi:4-hydroxy-3-polyprenylbenzoate decarboxylase
MGMGDGEGLARRWSERMRELRPIPHQIVADGPVFENVLKGDAIDLFKFPTPKWHENDGARYIGTGVCVINKDPDSGFVNAGAYRVSIQDAKTCGLFIEHGKDGDVIRHKHWARGEKCPVVVTVGQEPIITALSGSAGRPARTDASEFDVAGALHGEAYPMVVGETGVPFPAYAEIAIEGYIPAPHDVMELEGPFGEWTGYYAHERRPETVIQVSAIYHRNDPIIFGAPPLRPVGFNYFANFGGDGAGMIARLEREGIQGVKRIYHLGAPSFQVVSVHQMYQGHVEDVIKHLVPAGEQYRGHNIWIFVDDDIDVTNPEELHWAIGSRLMPESGVRVLPGRAVWQLDPRIPPGERSNPDEEGRLTYRADDLVLNCCRPYEWIDKFPPVAVNSPELRERTRNKWKYLFE